MDEVYEYRRAPSKGAVLLAAFGVVMLLTAVIINDADHLLWLVWVSGAVTITWMILPKPVYGIKVDDKHLVLSAWRKPRHVWLDDIDHLRATNISEETNVAVVYKNGKEEGIFAADLPDIDTLIAVMATRGIPVRNAY